MTRPTLIFLPGHMCDERVWAAIADRFAKLGYPVAHARLDRDDSVDGMAARVLAEHKGDLIAIGFSMGAIVALALHRAAPERILGLCLVGINAGPDLPERSGARIAQQEAVQAGGLKDVITEQMLPHYFARTTEQVEALSELCVAMALSVGADAFVKQSEALRLRPSARPGLAAIECPTLVIGGEEDRLCPPAWHHETAQAIPNAALTIVENGGHMALIERDGALFDRIDQWLNEGQARV